MKDEASDTCKNKCINGYCSQPDKCTCYKNYTLHPNDTFLCQPICQPICRNGECISPGECSCYKDFQLEKGNVCVPIRNETNTMSIREKHAFAEAETSAINQR